MKKRSVLCSLLILCSTLAACDTADIVIPGNPAGNTAPAVQTSENPAASAPEAEEPLPEPEMPEIVYLPPAACGMPDDSDYTPPVSTILEQISQYNALGVSYAVCRVTVRNIDYSNHAGEFFSPSAEISLDWFYAASPDIPKQKGTILTIENTFSAYSDPDDGMVYIQREKFGFPAAEIGKQYIALLSKQNSESSYSMAALTVPLPDKREATPEYFAEQYEKMNMSANNISAFLSETVMIHWYYNDIVPTALMGTWAKWAGSGNMTSADSTISTEKFYPIQVGTEVSGFIDEFGLPYRIDIGNHSTTGFYKTVEGGTVRVETDIDLIHGSQFGTNHILNIIYGGSV